MHYFSPFSKFLSFTFLLLQKSNKKGAPNSITPRIRDGSLITLLYYCKLKFSSLICSTLKNQGPFQ